MAPHKQILLVFTILCVLLYSCKTESSVRELKLAHGLNTGHPVHLGMVYLAERVKDLSNGQLIIRIYPNQQLGTERQTLELLQLGSVEMTKVSVSVMENFSPDIKVLGLPYLFRDRHHLYRVLDGPIGQALLDGSARYWLKGLTYFDAGARSFYTKTRPIHSPEDLEGLKIRVQESKTAMDMVKAFNASPTPISWGELYSALQQGIVDGAENNPPSFYTSRHYELCKYYTLNEHTAVPDILVISTHAWNRLSEVEKEWMSEAAKDAGQYQRIIWQKSEEESLAAVEKAGVLIIRPDKSLFAQKTLHLFEEYRDDPHIYDMIRSIRKERK